MKSTSMLSGLTGQQFFIGGNVSLPQFTCMTNDFAAFSKCLIVCAALLGAGPKFCTYALAAVLRTRTRQEIQSL